MAGTRGSAEMKELRGHLSVPAGYNLSASGVYTPLAQELYTTGGPL